MPTLHYLKCSDMLPDMLPETHLFFYLAQFIALCKKLTASCVLLCVLYYVLSCVLTCVFLSVYHPCNTFSYAKGRSWESVQRVKGLSEAWGSKFIERYPWYVSLQLYYLLSVMVDILSLLEVKNEHVLNCYVHFHLHFRNNFREI